MIWAISNLSAANDPALPTGQMLLNADWATLYSPADESSIDVPPAYMPANIVINYNHPDTGIPPAVGDEFWAYLIAGDAVVPRGIVSKDPPRFGPQMPASYTHYAPAFPVILTGSGVMPVGANLAPSTLQVIDDWVFFISPLLIYPDGGVASYPTASFSSLKSYIPSAAKICSLQLNPELHSAGQMIAGAVAQTGNCNFFNSSLYPNAWWSAGDYAVNFPLISRDLKLQFLVSAGVKDASLADCLVLGYKFNR